MPVFQVIFQKIIRLKAREAQCSRYAPQEALAFIRRNLSIYQAISGVSKGILLHLQAGLGCRIKKVGLFESLEIWTWLED